LLAEYLEEQDYKRLILILEDPKRRAQYPPQADYYLGEAYRLRGEKGDTDKALAAWRRCLQRQPGFAPAHRALGLYALRHQQPKLARAHLRRYLALAPKARDHAYIDSYLRRLDKQP
jgi:tetratricopeptide (TPR) repeat protein